MLQYQCTQASPSFCLSCVMRKLIPAAAAAAAAAFIPAGIAGAWIGVTIQHCGNHGAMSTLPFINLLLGGCDDLIGGSSLMWRYHHQVGDMCLFGRGYCTALRTAQHPKHDSNPVDVIEIEMCTASLRCSRWLSGRGLTWMDDKRLPQKHKNSSRLWQLQEGC